MADLELAGTLELTGRLDLSADGGEVTASGFGVLVEHQPEVDPAHHRAAPPVVLPPPPSSPIDAGATVWAVASANATVTADRTPIIAQGMVLQGHGPTWPGMVLRSQRNPTVTINRLPINVDGDQAAVFPSGAVVVLQSGGG